MTLSPEILKYLKINGKSVILFHYGKKGLTNLSSDKFGSNSYSNDEMKSWGRPRIFFYTDPKQKESVLGNNNVLYETNYPIEEIYPISEDPLHYGDKINLEPEMVKKEGYYLIVFKEGSDFNKVLNELTPDFLKKFKITSKINNDDKSVEVKVYTKNINNFEKLYSDKLDALDSVDYHSTVQGSIQPQLKNYYEEIFKLASKDGFTAFIYPQEKGNLNTLIVSSWKNSVPIGKESLNENKISDITSYLKQVQSNKYLPLSIELFEMISEEGFLGDLENIKGKELFRGDFQYTILKLSNEDKEGLKTFDDNTVNKFNSFDIKLKELQKEYPTTVDFIDYDNGVIYIIKLINNLNEEFKHNNVTLYHGTCLENANELIKNGWSPLKNGIGGNMGNPNYLYLSSEAEDALWFAEEKGCNTIIQINNIPIDYLRPDPEDESSFTMADLLNRKGIPSKFILTKPLSSEHFTLKNNLNETKEDNTNEYKKIGSIIKKTLKDNSAFEILDKYKEFEGCTFSAGGCYPLALALKELFPTKKLKVIKNKDGIVQHVLLEVEPNFYLDSDGLEDGNKKIQNAKLELVDRPYISDFNSNELGGLGSAEPKLIQDLITYLSKFINS